MYNKVNPNLNFVQREQETAKFWEDNDIFNKSVRQNEGHPIYMFYDGPPTANGKPHIGHVETRVIKDMIPRYHTMKGEQVPRKAGWDTHGLPVELEVEKEIGIEGKDQIEAYGIEPFIKSARSRCGNIRECGRSFPDRSASGQTWIIPMLPIMMIILSPNGGHCSRSGTRIFCIRASR